MIKLKLNGERAKLAITMMWLSIVAALLMLASEAYTYSMLVDLKRGSFPSADKLQFYTLFVGAAAVIFVIMFVLTAIYFIMWFRRAYYNLHQIYKKGLKYGEGWAAGAWFVPIFNLFGPYQIATELFDRSEKYIAKNDLNEPTKKGFSSKGWWWGLWITSSVFSQVSTRMEDESLSTVPVVIAMVASVISVGAGYFAIQMIKEYGEMETIMLNANSTMTVDATDLLDSNM